MRHLHASGKGCRHPGAWKQCQDEWPQLALAQPVRPPQAIHPRVTISLHLLAGEKVQVKVEFHDVQHTLASHAKTYASVVRPRDAHSVPTTFDGARDIQPEPLKSTPLDRPGTAPAPSPDEGHKKQQQTCEVRRCLRRTDAPRILLAQLALSQPA